MHRAGLSLPELLDQHDALLQLRLALLELLYLLNDRVQPYGFLLRGGNLGIDPGGIAREARVAPADEHAGQHEDQAAANRQLLTDGQCGGPFLRGRAFDGEQVDANHRSPTRRSASPTATAAVAMMFSGSVTPNFAGSNDTVRNGSNDTTADPNRS